MPRSRPSFAWGYRQARKISPGREDVTQRLLADSSTGPGESVALVRKASAAPIDLPPSLVAALRALQLDLARDPTMGFTSKPFAYGGVFRYLKKRDHGNIIRLIKGGRVKVFQVNDRPPHGSRAKSDAPYGDRYYVMVAIG